MHSARRYSGWKWRLIRWATGGTIEVVPLLPARVIGQTETLLVRLDEGHFTAEVQMPTATTSLLPMVDLAADPVPGTFIALDMADGTRLVGTFKYWQFITYDDGKGPIISGTEVTSEVGIVLESPSGEEIIRPFRTITAGYWAPMGYRP